MSYNTSTDFLKAISDILDKEVTDQVRKFSVLTIMTDESADIVVNHKLCISALVVDPVSLHPQYFAQTCRFFLLLELVFIQK